MTEKLPRVSEFKFNKYKILDMRNKNRLYRRRPSMFRFAAAIRKQISQRCWHRSTPLRSMRRTSIQSFQTKSKRRKETVVMTTM
jgi:hypothetical protein